MPTVIRVTTLRITLDELEPYEPKGSRTVLRGVGGGNIPRLLDTDLIFAMFDLLGMQFSPRIRDLKDQSLCKVKGKEWNYPALKFTTTVNPEYIKRHWDGVPRTNY
jgi:hypothetical protein